MVSEHLQDITHLHQTATPAVSVRVFYVLTVAVNVWVETAYLVADATRSEVSALQM